MTTKTARKPKPKSKPKTEKQKQTRIEGTHDPIPQDLADKVEEYVDTLRSRMKTQREEDALRIEVIELMNKHSVERVPLADDEQKYLLLDHGKDKVVIKKRKKNEAEE
jgi:CBS domain-containing protein